MKCRTWRRWDDLRASGLSTRAIRAVIADEVAAAGPAEIPPAPKQVERLPFGATS